MSVERKWAFRIEHILEAIAKIQRYIQGMTEESFAASDRTRQERSQGKPLMFNG